MVTLRRGRGLGSAEHERLFTTRHGISGEHGTKSRTRAHGIPRGLPWTTPPSRDLSPLAAGVSPSQAMIFKRSSLASYVVSRSNVCIKSACILEIIVKYQFTMVRYGTCCALINETLRHPQKLSFLCLLPPPPIYFVWLATPSILARTSS